MDKTAIVILNYNGVDYLKRFLPKVVTNSENCQIAVIDNNSDDASVALLKNDYPDVQIIALNQNYGFSGGYNKGLAYVQADNYILLNSDVEVTPGWAEQMIKFMRSHPEVAICQPKILSLQHKNQFDYAGAAGGYLDILGYPFCRGRIFNYLEKDQGQYNDNRIIFWAGGACFFIRANVFKELGGFDEDFFAHMEEIDLCWRSHRAGYQTAYVGNSHIYHLRGGTLNDSNPFKTYLNFRNGLQLLLKNCSLQELIWKLPVRMVLDLVASIRFLIQGYLFHFLAVLKAEFMFLVLLPQTLKRRRAFKAPYRTKLFNIILVWEYFIKGKRTFRLLRGSN